MSDPLTLNVTKKVLFGSAVLLPGDVLFLSENAEAGHRVSVVRFLADESLPLAMGLFESGGASTRSHGVPETWDRLAAAFNAQTARQPRRGTTKGKGA